MSNIAISVENLGKKYQIGELERYYTLRDSLTHLLNYPLRFLNKKEIKEEEKEFIWALKDVSFEIKHGEVVGIIGRNGAGKTTLLKILSRITEPTEGYARINGRVASLLEVGTGFHPELTGRENIYLNGSILGMSHAEIKRKFDEIVDFAETEKFLDTPLKRYSSGMQVRLAFAVAAHLEPEILIIDEVLAVGDAAFQKKCIGKMGNVATEGRTVLFVSHNMSAIQTLCNSGILLENGMIKGYDKVNKVVDEYLKNIIVISSTPLHSRFDRSGKGTARFVSIRLKNDDDMPISNLRSGDNLKICLTVDTKEPIVNSNFILSFYNIIGQKVFHCSTNTVGFTGIKLNKIINSTTVVCYVPELPLPPGNYHINIALYSNNELIDHVESAISISVLEGDFFGSGKIPNNDGSVVFVKHGWFYS